VPPRPVVVHVFVHGTILPGFSKDFLLRTQIMLNQGLVEIPDEWIASWQEKKLPRKLMRCAAVHIAAAYDQFVEKDGSINKYYAYSWGGLLEDAYRRHEAKNMYLKLIELRDILVKQYPESPISFILHGHSHGGNVILYLARYEKKFKKHLPISAACLYATPIQQETVRYAKDPLFKTIFIMYSEGDYVQNNDRFSSKKSYRKFSDLIPLAGAKNTIYEICACAYRKPTAFGHAAFFWLNSYQLTRVHRGKRPHHLALIALNPLPLITFCPLVLKLLAQLPAHDHVIKLCVEGGPEKCIFTAAHDKEYAKSENIFVQLSTIKQVLKKNWH